jgi:molybdenum cofactor synthesis domain-containing protein
VKIRVITISDRASRGEYDDLSGPEIERVLAERAPTASLSSEIVPDECEAIVQAFERAADAGADWIITSGGTGIGPRDLTPEATRSWIDRELPGIAELLRAKSLEETPFAVFSRGVAGIRGSRIVVNLPGSPKAARLGANLLAPLLEHGIAIASSGGH